jgi:hypothetical protein
MTDTTSTAKNLINITPDGLTSPIKVIVPEMPYTVTDDDPGVYSCKVVLYGNYIW